MKEAIWVEALVELAQQNVEIVRDFRRLVDEWFQLEMTSLKERYRQCTDEEAERRSDDCWSRENIRDLSSHLVIVALYCVVELKTQKILSWRYPDLEELRKRPDFRDMEKKLEELRKLPDSRDRKKKLKEFRKLDNFRDMEKKLEELRNLHKFRYMEKKLKNDFGIDLSSLDGLADVNELRCLNNAIKHEGKVSPELHAAEESRWTEGDLLGDLSSHFDRFADAVPRYIRALAQKVASSSPQSVFP